MAPQLPKKVTLPRPARPTLKQQLAAQRALEAALKQTFKRGRI